MRRAALPLVALTRASDRLSGLDRWLAHRLQASVARADVQLQLWDGSLLPFAGEPIGTLTVQDRGALWGLILTPETAFGDHYMSGRVAVGGDFSGLVERLTKLSRPGPPSAYERVARWCTPSNGLPGARRNVHHHYDLGNEFYAQWLDPQLVYTCAWYPDAAARLAEAQVAKLDLVCRKLQLRPGERVVEAGCGWGALALHMARHYGVTVRAYNISTEQLRFARARAADEGLEHLVTFVEDDYRNVTGRYDAFVSLGMLEHVGLRRYLGARGNARACARPAVGARAAPLHRARSSAAPERMDPAADLPRRISADAGRGIAAGARAGWHVGAPRREPAGALRPDARGLARSVRGGGTQDRVEIRRAVLSRVAAVSGGIGGRLPDRVDAAVPGGVRAGGWTCGRAA